MSETAGRDKVMRAVRKAVAGLGKEPRAELPDYEATELVAEGRLAGHDSLMGAFEQQFAAVHGRCLREVAALANFLNDAGHRRGCCDPQLRAVVGEALEAAGLEVEYGYRREDYDGYDFGITVASGAIAETGSVILKDEATFDRLAALTPWVHVAVLRGNQIVRTIADAIATFGDSRNVVWCTGPSKTADVEGILIEGVHGPGEQIALFIE